MSFSERQKAIALAIVHCFETSKPFGSPDTVAVLTDGAGFSVGISQFTHRSGSLRKVVSRYLRLGGTVAADVLAELSDDLMDTSAANIRTVSRNARYKKALQDAGKTAIMRTAQEQIAFENYLGPAIAAGEGSNFKTTMALACIYDAKNQGGFDTCRDRTSAERKNFNDADSWERAWLKEFCMERRSWLASSGKQVVRNTVYRPDFFLGEISKGNWSLEPPLNVHGVKLTKAMFSDSTTAVSNLPAKLAALDTSDTPATDEPQSPPLPIDAPVQQTAEQIINTAESDVPKIEAAQNSDAHELEDSKRTGIVSKIWAFIILVFTGQATLPQFVTDSDSGFWGIVARIFAGLWEFKVYLLGALFIWFITVKLEATVMKAIAAKYNTDPTRSNIILVPPTQKTFWQSVKFW